MFSYADHRFIIGTLMAMFIAFIFSGDALGIYMLYRVFKKMSQEQKEGAKNRVKLFFAFFGRHKMLAIFAIFSIMLAASTVGVFIYMTTIFGAATAWMIFIFSLAKPKLKDAALSFRRTRRPTAPAFNMPSWTTTVPCGGPAPAAPSSMMTLDIINVRKTKTDQPICKILD